MENLFPNKDKILNSVLAILIPENVLNHFSVVDIVEYPDRWQIELEENKENVPDVLKHREGVVLDGFCVPLCLICHYISVKEVVLRLRRRRWKLRKQKCSTDLKHYSNTYNFHPIGAKVTYDLAELLKKRYAKVI